MSEKKSRPKHETVKAHTKSNASAIWMTASLILAILLVVSIVTSGFGIVKPTVKSIVSDINTLNSQSKDESLKNTLDDVSAALEPFKEQSKSDYSGKKVLITEYSDFQCPFCKRANDDAVAKIKKNFADAVTFEFKHYPLSFHPNAQKAAEASECARDQAKFWEMHDKLFLDQQKLDVDNLKKYAKELGLDTAKFNTCLDGGQKASIVQAQFNEGQQKGVQGTPAFFIGGTLISGAQPYESFLPLICKEIPEHTACINAPKPVTFKLYIIEDKRCADCDTSRITDALKQIFSSAEVETLDYSSAKGKELYNIAGLVYLPMYLFESKVKDDAGFSKVQGAIVQKGDYYALIPQAIGATYNPEAIKSDKPTVELFVMSYCPFGTQAEKGILPAVKVLGDKIDFKIRFVSYVMHGEKEVKENLNQYCIQKEQPDKYLKYLACFLNDSIGQGSASAISSCLTQTGIDTAKLDLCKTAADTQFNVMKNFDEKTPTSKFDIDVALNDKYGVQGSPTLIINGDVSGAGRDSASYLAAICSAFNTVPSECQTQLSSTTPGPGFGYDSVGSANAAGCGT